MRDEERREAHLRSRDPLDPQPGEEQTQSDSQLAGEEVCGKSLLWAASIDLAEHSCPVPLDGNRSLSFSPSIPHDFVRRLIELDEFRETQFGSMVMGGRFDAHLKSVMCRSPSFCSVVQSPVLSFGRWLHSLLRAKKVCHVRPFGPSYRPF